MGAETERDEILSGKGEKQIQAMRQEAEEIVEFYKKLKAQNDSHGRSIVGLTTEKEDVRLRIRALLNKRTAGEGPDFDEYQIQRRVSRTYQPIDPKRRKSSATKRGPPTTSEYSHAEVAIAEKPAEFSAVTITVKAD